MKPESSPKATILVIEDEPGLLEILTVNLEGSGYRAIPAADGLEAWRRFEERRPDLIILDLNLPKLSGFRLLELFRRDEASIPILVLTAYDFAEVEELAEYGLEGFITKPFSPEEVVSMVGHLLGE
ncbi:MAG: response regulator [Anaerolineae bacterium]